ncbi:polysaccharide biosynthesis/export family protein [Polaribacter septentrionalilitoris]|uniref:polysaccharide biosynthesis/export family protein n=1 Tax=Polaribacter septentrionalilitoris TaxID=2494657 RepID=UPI0013588CDC|nr:polysaccharide biosynthesis/export family protein [Polaribacter septentrionalilitoris]
MKFAKKNKLYSFILVYLLVLFSSCVSNKKIAYFQIDEIKQEDVNNNYKTIFRPDDLLQITVSSKDLMAARIFNLPAVAYSTTTNSVVGTPQQQPYLIDNNGYIDFPVLGKILAGGKTREELISIIKSKIAPDYLKDPTINIRIVNFKITVSGDVMRPGTFTVNNERITILEALGLAGDLNISARRDNVLVIREEKGMKNEYVVNLLSKKTLTSPVFYLKQNDLIYVQHNKAKIQDAAYTRSTGLFISLASVLISLLTIITR